MRWRHYIVGSLWSGALLFVVLVVAGILWALLAAAGDPTGAAGAKGVALVAVVCGVLNFVVLVVLLALAQVSDTQPADEEEIEE